jgi:cephalosporin hydroxylase
MGAYVRDRLRQHLRDAYAGVPMAKFPEDLRVYEHLLWLCAPDAVIELGAQSGGSALWFRDRLRTLALYGRVRAPLVVSIDLDVEGARERLARADPAYAETITLVRGDVRDPDLPAVVGRLLPDGAACFVVEDSAHTYETTSAALEGFCRFVPPGGMFVVEDGCVDVEELRLSKDWPRGVLPAIRDWLATEAGSAFEVRRDLELYGVSCHPEGFLQRT